MSGKTDMTGIQLAPIKMASKPDIEAKLAHAHSFRSVSEIDCIDTESSKGIEKKDVDGSNVQIEHGEIIAEDERPFPWLAMSSLCIGMLAHSVVFTNPLPYVAFMVVDFGMSPTVDSAGYYAGWITGTFMIGRTCTGLLWGMASDRYGRRPCLLITMFNVALFGLLLGFSTSFTMAVLLRLAIGLGNGFMGVAKTCISEICSKEHELKAFGMLNGIWGLGLIVGPAVGGLLSRPAIQYPGYFTQDSIWRKFPYLMPCAVCSSIAVVGFFSIFFWLPETAGMNFVEKEVNITTSSLNAKNSKKYFNFKNKNKKFMDRSSVAFSPLNGNDKDKNLFSIEGDSDDEEGDIENGEKGHFHDGGEFDSSEDTTLESDDDGDDNIKNENNNEKIVTKTQIMDSKNYKKIPLHKTKSLKKLIPESKNILDDNIIINDNNSPVNNKPQSLSELLRNKDIRFLSLLYTFFCFSVMFVDEVFPLWAVSSLMKGGLAWSSAQVGAVLASVGALLIIFQIFFYEKLVKNCCLGGAGSTFFRMTFIAGMAVFILPIVTHFAQIYSVQNINKTSLNSDVYKGDFNITDVNHSRTYASTHSFLNVFSNSIYTKSFQNTENDGFLYLNGMKNQEYNNHFYTNQMANNTMYYQNGTDTGVNNISTIHASDSSFWTVFLSIVAVLTVYRTFATSAFTTLGIITNASVDKELRGTLNGFIMTMGSVGNACGPILGSIFYAMSIDLPPPFDGRIIFFIVALVFAAISLVARKYLKDNSTST